MRKTKLLISSSYILLVFLYLSSCDKKNTFLVNRRNATPAHDKEGYHREEYDGRGFDKDGNHKGY